MTLKHYCTVDIKYSSSVLSRDSLLLKRRARDRKVASSNPGRSGRRMFFSRVKFGVRSTPVPSQWHVKDPGHSAKNAGGRLHLNKHAPLTQRSRSGLTRHSMGTCQEKSSHAFHQRTLSHSLLSTLSQCGLILA